MLRVIVNGAKGRLGSLACEVLKDREQFTLVAELGRRDNLLQTIIDTEADIVLELTCAESVFENSLAIIEAGAHPVIGATGLLPPQIASLTALCQTKKLGAIIAPNFSMGAILTMICAAKVAAHFSVVEIIEAHHQGKQDSPSGTAIKTAQMVLDSRLQPQTTLKTKEVLPGARGASYEGIPIHSLRLPGILARQEVIFGGPGETLTITHNSLDKSCFIPGIVLACEQVTKLQGLVYGLEHLL